MRVRARIEYKYPMTEGISQTTGNKWQAQEVKLRILKEDGSDTNDTLVARCMEAIIIGSPMFEVGKTGYVGIWLNAEEYNGRCYQKARLNGFEPAEFKGGDKDHPFEQLNEKTDNPSGDPQVAGDDELPY